MNVCVIAESSWDIECLQSQDFQVDKKFTHNDFFADVLANDRNTKLVIRFFSFVKMFCLASLWAMRRKNIVFTSFNAEALIVAKLFARYSCSYLFCSNVMSNPISENISSSKRLCSIYKLFSGKLFVTDEVSLDSLRDYQPQLTSNYFQFSVPNKNNLEDILFVIVMPAVLSHRNTVSKSHLFYLFSEYLINWLGGKSLKFVVLPHPREFESVKKMDFISSNVKVVSQKILLNESCDKCYLSSFSSLSLNKRYGGNYGFWVKHPDFNILPNGINSKWLKKLDELIED